MAMLIALQLRHDARVTLDALNSSSETENVFKDVFLQDHRALAARFDIVLRCGSTLWKGLSRAYFD
jgi:hypothetical protein